MPHSFALPRKRTYGVYSKPFPTEGDGSKEKALREFHAFCYDRGFKGSKLITPQYLKDNPDFLSKQVQLENDNRLNRYGYKTIYDLTRVKAGLDHYLTNQDNHSK